MNTAHTPGPAVLRPMAPGEDFTLPEGDLLHLVPAGAGGLCPWQVQVRSGAVWLTWPGCQDDVFLSAGQAASLPASARALVQVEPRLAKGAAVLRLVVADRTGHEVRTGWARLLGRFRIQRLPW